MTSTVGHDRSRAIGGSESAALRELASRVGIVAEYFDLHGNVHRTSDQTRRALLTALGFDVSDETSVREALQRIVRAELDELIAPVNVVRRSDLADVMLSVHPPVDAHGAGSCELEVEAENGDWHASQGPWGGGVSAPAMLPAQLPIGYHRLRFTLTVGGQSWTNEQTLIVTPDRCFTPSDLLGGDRAFGLIANLYTIRSAANWGVGDLSDLAKLAEWGGSVGADFVGVNPLHALLNRGTDVSPYSPVSRLYRNPIYIDVMRVPELRDAPELADHLTSPEFVSGLDALRE